MFRYFTLAVVVLGVIGGGIGIYKLEKGNTIPYKSPEKEVVEKRVEVQVDMLNKRIEDAINASSTEIENEARKAYDDAKEHMVDVITLQVIEEFDAEVTKLKVDQQKKVGSY